MRNIPAAFKEVSPSWYAVFSQCKNMSELNQLALDSKDHSGMTLGHGANCVVGEAWLWTEPYWVSDGREDNIEACVECSRMSGLFNNIITGEKDEFGPRKRQMLKNITAFTAHWKAEHNPLIGTIPDLELSVIEVQQPKAN